MGCLFVEHRQLEVGQLLVGLIHYPEELQNSSLELGLLGHDEGLFAKAGG